MMGNRMLAAKSIVTHKWHRCVACYCLCLFFLSLPFLLKAETSSLPETIVKIKPSIVGVGTYLPIRQPRSNLTGTGFVVADGRYVITNAHVVAEELKELKKERRVVFVGTGRSPKVLKVEIVKRDDEHDLALLRILEGPVLPALRIGSSASVKEGQLYAFTGFPIGAVLGLYPVTHQGIVSSITPIAIPAFHSGQLNPKLIRRLKEPYRVFQLDATAYPGNSGSPLYDTDSGEVIGVINKVFVKGTKEAALANPSGIAYAVPAKHIKALLNEIK